MRTTLNLDDQALQEAKAHAQGRSRSEVVNEALRAGRKLRQQEALRSLQGYWAARARERGLVTEEDLERYLRA